MITNYLSNKFNISSKSFNFSKKLLCSIITFSFIISTNAKAVLMETARARSFIGGASISDYAMDGAFLNPASLALSGVLAFGGGFSDGYLGERDHEKSLYAWSLDSLNGSFNTASLIKSREDLMSVRGFPLAAALSYQKSKTTGALPARYDSYGLNLAKAFNRRLSLGFYINALNIDERASSGRSDFSWSGGLGAVYRITNNFNFGVSGQNLFDTGDPIELEELGENRSAQLALSYKIKDIFKIFTDLKYDFTQETFYLVGAFDSKMSNFLSFRLSAGYDEALEGMRLGFGLSFMGPKLQTHYGVALDADSGSALHSVDFSLPF